MAVNQIGITVGGNKKNFLGLPTDTKPVTDLGAGSTFKETNTGNMYIFDGTAWQQDQMKYKDLGQIITATNMAAGASVTSSWVDNVQWVRNLISLTNSDQQCDLLIERRDTALITSTPQTLLATIPTAPGWVPRTFTPQNGATVGSLLGYSVRFTLKNSNVSANTYLNLRVQMFGQI